MLHYPGLRPRQLTSSPFARDRNLRPRGRHHLQRLYGARTWTRACRRLGSPPRPAVIKTPYASSTFTVITAQANAGNASGTAPPGAASPGRGPRGRAFGVGAADRHVFLLRILCDRGERGGPGDLDVTGERGMPASPEGWRP